MGSNDGSIIATIIATHMPRNAATVPGPLCPGIHIPGIDLDRHPRTVTTAPMAKSSAKVAKNAHSARSRRAISRPRVRQWRPGLESALAVLIMPAPPGACFVAALGGTVEPRVH